MTPSTITTTRRGSGGPGNDATNAYEALFKERPNDDDIAIAQREHGYHPDGYGGPMRVRITQEPNGEWRVTWESWASCD
jgi:hypothetical protein